jgi:transcriptional regulator with XRE-family HTH domain
MHDLIARGVAAARQRNGWTQEQAAGAFRSLGLTTWRTGTVGQLEAGLRRPRMDEVLLIAAALQVSLEELIPGEDEQVELGDGAFMTPRAIRALLRSYDDFGGMPGEDAYFPGLAKLAEVMERGEEDNRRLRERFRPLRGWAVNHGRKITAKDFHAVLRVPTDAERHAARRLKVEPADVMYGARMLWGKNFTDERDTRVGDTSGLEPRSVQARRGIVTRTMLAELRTMFDETGYPGEVPPDGQ